MTKYLIGAVGALVGVLAGAWLMLAPFLVKYQKVGQDWIDATKNDLWTGGALIAVSALTLVLFLAFAVRDAVTKKAAFEASEADQAEIQQG